MARVSGTYETTATMGEHVEAFLPFALPPRDPPLDLGGERGAMLERACYTLSKLELAGEMIPSIEWFVYAFVRKEAILSSQIEGTQATLVDLFSSELDDRAPAHADVEEVCNYLDALQVMRAELSAEGGLPMSIRLLKLGHAQLMKGVRGETKQPGEVRRSQNWIGGTRPGNASFVPPPPHLVNGLLGTLERYIHTEDNSLHPLVRVGLIHVQFETIHPFLDGNGRLGRLLISLLLEEYGLLGRPLLYLSLFLKRHRQLYYERLSRVRTHGDWEGWIDFFLEGVHVAGEEAVGAARALFALVNEDEKRLLAHKSVTIPMIHTLRMLPQRPILTARALAGWLDVSRPTASKCISTLEELGILEQAGEQERDRVYHYREYLDLLGNEEPEIG